MHPAAPVRRTNLYNMGFDPFLGRGATRRENCESNDGDHSIGIIALM
jgi:hypothetical protein